MAKGKSFFESRGFKVALKYLYGWGASVVILGALFKILHWPGANEMLIVGLGTESVIFFISGLEPLPPEEKHWNWAKVFPQLKEEDEEEELELELLGEGKPQQAVSGPALLGLGLQGTQQALQESQLTPELFENLADTIKSLNVSVTKVSEVADITVTTNEFNEKLRTAAQKLDQLTTNYSGAVQVMSEFSNSLDALKQYQKEIIKVNQSLEALNAIYEEELKDAQKHMNAINHFYSNLTGVIENLVQTAKDANVVKEEVTKLAANLRQLNTIYGGMLSAMRGSA
jgi:gliding motility-associated protein GldL